MESSDDFESHWHIMRVNDQLTVNFSFDKNGVSNLKASKYLEFLFLTRSFAPRFYFRLMPLRKRNSINFSVILQKRVLSIVSDREKVEKESQLVRNDIEKQREALRGIKKEMKSYTVPKVYDYISQSQETETV